MRKIVMPLFVILLLGIAAPRADAQVQYGAQISFADDTDLGIGVRGAFGLGQYIENLTGVASFDLFFPDSPSGVDFTYWELNLNGHMPFQLQGSTSLAPYFGGGLNIAHASVSGGGISDSNTDFGLNLLAGTKFAAMGNLMPFVEIRLELSGGEQFVLVGGVYF